VCGPCCNQSKVGDEFFPELQVDYSTSLSVSEQHKQTNKKSVT
jgi:hypothetical protein